MYHGLMDFVVVPSERGGSQATLEACTKQLNCLLLLQILYCHGGVLEYGELWIVYTIQYFGCVEVPQHGPPHFTPRLRAHQLGIWIAIWTISQHLDGFHGHGSWSNCNVALTLWIKYKSTSRLLNLQLPYPWTRWTDKYTKQSCNCGWEISVKIISVGHTNFLVKVELTWV